MKKWISVCAAVLLLLTTAMPAAAQVSVDPVGTVSSELYFSYNYDLQGNSVPAPETYLPKYEVGGTLEDPWSSPTDVYVRDDVIYVLDAGNSRIVVLDKELNFVRYIQPEGYSLADGSGLFVEPDGTLYVTLVQQQQVLVMNAGGEVILTIGKPESSVFTTDVVYAPNRVAVGADDCIYVVSANVYQGVLQFNKQGEFLRFYAANTVETTVSAVLSSWFKSLFSNKQKDKMEKVVPTELTAIDVDSSGFLYSCSAVADGSKEELKRYDVEGNNILVFDTEAANGIVMGTGDYGDIEYTLDTQNIQLSGRKIDTEFIDVAVDDQQLLYALDQQRSKVFVYDNNSNLLAIFGVAGQQKGTFVTPVALDTIGGRVLVLDKGKNSLIVFDPSTYMDALKEAVGLYEDGLFSEALGAWEIVKSYNENMAIVYEGLGNAYMASGEYEEAMNNFRLANDKNGYDEAFAMQRDEWIAQYFYLLFAGVILLLVAAWIVIAKKTDTVAADSKPGRYISPFYVMLHPFNGFDEIRFKERGSIGIACVLLVLTFLSHIVSMQFTGYVFNDYSGETINIPYQIFQVLVLFAVFTACNFAVSELNDGKGFFRHVFISTAYALLPFILCSFASTLFSNVLTMREEVLLGFLQQAGLWWSVLLIVVSQIQIHMYSFGKAILSLLYTVFGMVCVAFVAITLFSLVGQLGDFLESLYNEVIFRM